MLVAVRGRTTGFYPVQDFTELTLDRVPPVLTITNPVVSTVTKPYLQLMGYASEQLSARSYDLTNALGLVTNNNLAVTGTFFDASNFSFSTNYFQCYDVPLEVGTNTITLRVSDLAGNVTTLSTNIVLDYTTATTAPVISFLWPSNGMYMSGNSFYIRGNISDETATMTAQWVDAANNTNVFTGIVERNGMFWVENLPLAAGTNVVNLTATDAAGNVSSTNLSVVKSSVVITVNSTAEGQDLYKPKGTVSGTISEHSYTVKVNGVTATVDVDGNWSAENVPNYGQGTATFDVIAEPPPPENSGGGGGGSGGGDDAGPTGALPTVGLGVEKELPTVVRVTKHLVGWALADGSHTYTWTKSYNADVETGGNGQTDTMKYEGNAESFDVYQYGNATYATRTKYRWSDADPNGIRQSENNYSGLGPEYPMGENDFLVKTLPDQTYDHTESSTTESSTFYVTQYTGKGVKHAWPRSGGADATVALNARTTETLFTGGKSGMMIPKTLFSLYAFASEYGKPDQAPWNRTPSTPVAASRIKVLGKQVGADYRVFAVLPNNATETVTVTVSGAKHHNAGVGATRHELIHATQCTALTDPRPDRLNLGVGEYVNFHFSPSVNMSFPEQPWWIVIGGGSLLPNFGDGTLFTAPSNAATATVRVFVRDVQLDTTYSVKEPSGVDHAVVSFRGEAPVGAGMDLKVFIAPLTVSFCRVDLMEVPGPGSNPSGYFTTNSIPPHDTDAKAGQWYRLREDNSWDDTARLYEWPYGRVGGFDWVIPVVWKIGDGNLNSLPSWTQRLESNGYKGKVTKFGHCSDQTPSDPISRDCGN